MSLITFSGIDCCGKSTQIDLLKAELQSRNRSYCVFWLRVGYTRGFSAMKAFARLVLGGKIAPAGHTLQRRDFMRRGWKRRAWLYFAISDMFWQTSVRIRWHQMLGRDVICDRYLLDSEFDLAMNFPEDAVPLWWSWRLMRNFAAKPDAAFLIHISFEESLRRAKEKNEPFPEDEDRRLRRSKMYEQAKTQGVWHVIDGTRTIADIRQEITQLVFKPRRSVEAAAGGLP